MTGIRLRFDGFIAGFGTASGTRIVLGHWPRSPFGPVADVMVEFPDGHRLLVASSPDLAAFVARTYRFDVVRAAPVAVSPGERTWIVDAGAIRFRFTVGARGPLGLALRAVPPVVAGRPGWAAVADLPARLLLPGVRTRGSAGTGRREWYGARDLRPILAAAATVDGRDLGRLVDVDPPVRFGFGSVPRRPALVRITTTIEVFDAHRSSKVG